MCGTAGEGGNVTLTCPAGSAITDFTYASYGTSTGSCPGPFTNGTCNGTNSLSVVEGLCKGRNSCTFTANNTTFTDPCVGTGKNMAVSALCGPEFAVATCSDGYGLQGAVGERSAHRRKLDEPRRNRDVPDAATSTEALSTGNPNTQMWIGARPSWTNYTISVPVRLDSGAGDGGINFRMQSAGTGNDSGQMYYAGITSGGVELGMENNGWTGFASSPATYAQGDVLHAPGERQRFDDHGQRRRRKYDHVRGLHLRVRLVRAPDVRRGDDVRGPGHGHLQLKGRIGAPAAPDSKAGAVAGAREPPVPRLPGRQAPRGPDCTPRSWPWTRAPISDRQRRGFAVAVQGGGLP